MILVPNSWGSEVVETRRKKKQGVAASVYAAKYLVRVREVNHCHGKGKGHPCEGGVAERPAVGPRIGLVAPDGKEHVSRATGGLGGYSEDHTDMARRLLNDQSGGGVVKALKAGYVRYWVRRGELALNFRGGNERTAALAIKFVHDNLQHGDRIYLDIEGPHGVLLGKFFDNEREARETIRRSVGLREANLREFNTCHGPSDGKFCSVGGKALKIVLPNRAKHAGDQLVDVNVAKFDAAYEQEGGFYLDKKGSGRIGRRYEGVKEFIAKSAAMNASEVTVAPDGHIGFSDGRHRYAFLRDSGLASIPMAMSPESVRNARKHGMVGTRQKKAA